jgi:hypothetical protein
LDLYQEGFIYSDGKFDRSNGRQSSSLHVRRPIQSDSVPRHSAVAGVSDLDWANVSPISFVPHPMTIAIRHLAFAAVSARGMSPATVSNGPPSTPTPLDDLFWND